MDLSKYIKYNEQYGLLEINDYAGELTLLPDDLFDSYAGMQHLNVSAKELAELPASFRNLQQLKGLRIWKTKLKELPAGIELMVHLEVLGIRDNSLMDFNKEAVKLTALPILKKLELEGYRGNKFPERISQLTALEELELPNHKKNEQALPDIMKVVASLPRLKRLKLDFPYGKTTPLLTAENLAVLDRLDEVDGSGWGYQRNNELSLAVGLTGRVSFRYRFEEVVPPFRAFVAGKSYTPLQKQLLFGLLVKNMKGIQELLPNKLATAIAEQQKPVLRLLDKPKGESLKSINTKLEQYGIKADNGADGADTIVVIGANSSMEEVEPFVVAGRTMITVDQLSEVLISGGDHWLLQEEHEPVNEQLLQLLCSNQVENYKVAFQIIGTGGANKSIQTLLAAIMMAHPEKEVHKAAEKLYDKYGSQAFKQHIKELKVSLRTSGDVDRKVAGIVRHGDIDGMLFRLMYHRIAGANDNITRVNAEIFSMKGIPDISLPREMVFFSGIRELHFDDCERFDIAGAIDVIRQMPGCRVLNVNGSHLTIPATIGQLTQLQTLEIAYNTLAEESALQGLQQLTILNVEGVKISTWDWLDSLTQLTALNVNNNGLKALPEQVYKLKHLQKLEAKQNKLTNVPERLSELRTLTYLDLSNNAITEFPYFLAGQVMETILLRSNKIAAIDTDRLYAANNHTTLNWQELNLARNQLTALQFREGMHTLRKLDVSNNQLEVLDDSLFTATLDAFYASHNKISVIPKAVLKKSFYSYFWLQYNYVTELPDYFARVSIQNCDLSYNKIHFIHPDFDKYGTENHGRLFWKLGNNALPKGKVGGIYI